MAKTIPCDSCEQYPAMFLITFTPRAETVGVGLECMPAWGDAIGAAMASEGAADIDPDALVFRVTAIPTGDEYQFTVGGVLAFVEVLVSAMDAEASAQAAGEGVEPITTTAKAGRPRKSTKRAPKAAQASQEVTDEAWEASGLDGRPPIGDAPEGDEVGQAAAAGGE